MLHPTPPGIFSHFWFAASLVESVESKGAWSWRVGGGATVPWVESTTWMMVGIAASFRHMETDLLQLEHMQQTNLLHDKEIVRISDDFYVIYGKMYIDFCNCFLKYGFLCALPLFDHHFMQLHSPFYPLANKHQRSTSTHCSNFIETPRWMVCWKLGKP